MPSGGLLVVLAHPDDETLVSGAMAHYAARGVPVTLLCATRGEAGEIAEGHKATPADLGEHRERELRLACDILGVRDVRFLPYRDSGMRGTPENDDPRSLFRAAEAGVVGAIAEVMRDVRPAVVVTWDATGGYGHPDHMTIHERTTQAFERDGESAALYYALIPAGEFGEIMQAAREEHPDAGTPGDVDDTLEMQSVPANCVLDVSDEYERKMRAMQAHGSQLGSFEIFLRVPEDLRKRMFGREHYHRVAPPVPDGVMLSDLFSG
ncbi:MAG TPA: PIG-L family deacetylase [Dehalococcoidia bacterium]|jgi:N-acetyl-1-D-myo-inositol-2-amino-2-deoxy-alpha-D-glucopyranoside deacetylase|nr:PIG-L family deacetylase [Dehalococcoidia bacterium]